MYTNDLCTSALLLHNRLIGVSIEAFPVISRPVCKITELSRINDMMSW